MLLQERTAFGRQSNELMRQLEDAKTLQRQTEQTMATLSGQSNNLARQLEGAQTQQRHNEVTMTSMRDHSSDMMRGIEEMKTRQRHDEVTMANMRRQFDGTVARLDSAREEIVCLRARLTTATMVADELKPVAIYLDGVDYKGRTLNQILSMSPSELEVTHDYIQVLFPTVELSGSNRQAPVVSEATLNALNADPVLRQRVEQGLLQSFDKMLTFYGLSRREDGTVSLTSPLTEDVQWVKEGNHNSLRLTRIISSLRLFGGGNLADSLKDFLLGTLPKDHSSAWYWQAA